jgi:sugar phosphate isomerase/epimerase
MRLVAPDGSALWLAYGMNVHAGGTADVLDAAILSTVEPLRERLDVDGPFGLALRLDRDGVAELVEDDDRRHLLRDMLRANDLVPFSGNAFVVGSFHDAGTKSNVYRPTWSEAERVEYTVAFAEVLADLAGPGADVSLSTAPLSFKPFSEATGFEDVAARRLVETARRFADVEERTGARVRLAIEPEPLCTIETTAEAIRFFAGPLARALGEIADRREAEAVRARLGVCYDVCHQAVEGEDPEESLLALAAARIPVVKVQASCALVLDDPSDAAGRAVLARFDEPRWLHQVAAGRHVPTPLLAADLPEALRGPSAASWAATAPWRVHLHVPVHRETLTPPLRTTRDVLERALRAVVRDGSCAHLEIETYTWDGLPSEVRAGGLVESLAREYEWVLGVLASEGVRRWSSEDAP